MELLQQLQELALCLLVGYIIPTAICIVFAFVYHHENPFKKESKTHDFTFAPVANFVCAVIIVCAFIPHEIWWVVKKQFKKIKEWTRKVLFN